MKSLRSWGPQKEPQKHWDRTPFFPCNELFPVSCINTFPNSQIYAIQVRCKRPDSSPTLSSMFLVIQKLKENYSEHSVYVNSLLKTSPNFGAGSPF